MKKIVSFVLVLALVCLSGMTFAEAEPHTCVFTDYVYNKDASCTSGGTKTAKCNVEGCNEKDTISDPEHPATGHSFTNYYLFMPATCTSPGAVEAECDNGCGTKDRKTGDPATGHSFTSYVYNNDATCEQPGTMTASCGNGCGVEDTIPDPEHPATGHSFTNYILIVPGTCSFPEALEAICDNGCGTEDTKEGDVADHSFTNYVSNNDATCISKGTKTASCDFGCGNTDTIEGDAVNPDVHPAANIVPATCVSSAYCTACGSSIGEPLEEDHLLRYYGCKHNPGTATHTAWCFECNVAVGDTYACDQDGGVEKSDVFGEHHPVCSVCGGCDVTTFLECSFVYRPSEEKEGYHDFYCEECWETEDDLWAYTDECTVETWTSNNDTVSCLEPGTESGVCIYCGRTVTRAMAPKHDYKLTVVEPTCTSKGYTLYECKVCKDSYKDNYTSKLYHWYDLWNSNGNGTHWAYCLRNKCDHVGNTNCEAWELAVDNTRYIICPVCGGGDALYFAAIEGAKAKGGMPRGEVIVRGSYAPVADAQNILFAFTAAVEYAGKVQDMNGTVEFTLPVNVSTGFSLVRVDNGASGQVLTEIPYAYNNGELSFVTDVPGLFLLMAE